MARKTSRQAIEKRILKSLQCFAEGDMGDALFNIAPVIDVVAKQRHKDKPRVGDRIKAFIFDEQHLIYYLSTQGKIPLKNGARIVYIADPGTNKPLGDHGGELSDFIYYNIRCAQSHDAEIDHDTIDLGRNFGIGKFALDGDGGDIKPGAFIISNATILALILSVICAHENRRIKLSGKISLFNKVSIEINKIVGNKTYLLTQLSELFDGGL